ncbi:MAG: hypothetical protein WDZ91_03045, partial [Paenibacillaceae bacterium]
EISLVLHVFFYGAVNSNDKKRPHPKFISDGAKGDIKRLELIRLGSYISIIYYNLAFVTASKHKSTGI